MKNCQMAQSAGGENRPAGHPPRGPPADFRRRPIGPFGNFLTTGPYPARSGQVLPRAGRDEPSPGRSDEPSLGPPDQASCGGGSDWPGPRRSGRVWPGSLAAAPTRAGRRPAWVGAAVGRAR